YMGAARSLDQCSSCSHSHTICAYCGYPCGNTRSAGGCRYVAVLARVPAELRREARAGHGVLVEDERRDAHVIDRVIIHAAAGEDCDLAAGHDREDMVEIVQRVVRQLRQPAKALRPDYLI